MTVNNPRTKFVLPLLLVSLLTNPVISLSASKFTDTFQELNKGQQLSDDFVSNYLGADPTIPRPGYNKWYVEEIPIFPNTKAKILIVRNEDPQSIGETLYAFSDKGKVVATLNLYVNANADAGPGLNTSYRHCGRTFYEVRNLMIDSFENTLHDYKTTTYTIEDNGNIKVSPDIDWCKKTKSYPEASIFKFTKESLKDLSTNDLRLMRNEIFARHGYIFNSKELKDHFKQFSWYIPKHKNVSKFLNDVERHNLKVIALYEK